MSPFSFRRLIGTGAGLIFKGSGFYITDYRSDSYKSGEKAATSSSNGAATATETSGGESRSGSATEAKPAAKAESPSPAKSGKPAKAAAKS